RAARVAPCPYTTLFRSVPRMGAEDTRRAVEAASRALPAWRAKPARERAGILRRLADLMLAEQERLALILTSEQGKPLEESRGERSEEHTSELQSPDHLV